MIDSNLSKEQADDIYESHKSVMNDVISWEEIEGSSQKIFIDVVTEDGLELRVSGWYRWKGTKRYGFALLYKRSIPIRRWDDTKGHPCPCTGTHTTGPHKHYYHPDHGDSCIYHVNDIRQGDVNGALMDFLKECHITPGKAKYQTIGAIE